MFHKLKLALPLFALTLLTIATPLEQREAAPGLIDDLLNGVLSPIAQLIKDILNGVTSSLTDEISPKPLICLSTLDSCCVWYDVSKKLTELFKQSDGQCNDNARAAVRAGFHDAGAWDKDSPNGGADGSLLMDFGEQDKAVNNGLQSIRLILRDVQATYKVGFGDLAQYAHNHATVTCPKGPRIRTLVGRIDATKAGFPELLPDVNDTPDNLIALFQRKGFTAHDLAALVGAHAAAKQRFVEPAKANFPLDTTPGVWDVEFYNDTLQNPQNPNIFVLPSDKKLSVHPEVSEEWNEFVGNQPHWNEDYGKAYFRMSLNGVVNLDDLTDCSKTLPSARPNWPN